MKKRHLIMSDEINEQDDVIPETPELDEQDDTDWKAKAQELQGQLKESRGIAKRYQTKLSKMNEPKPPVEPKVEPPAEKKGFDYSHLAYLEAKGINEAEDIKYLEGLQKESGLELKDLMAKSWVQAELKERKDIRMSETATPPSGKRSNQSAKDSVDYWIAKGELPPEDQGELRVKVVNAKIAAEKAKANTAFGTAGSFIVK